ncbi:hypothetical protein H072_10945 [Dactylellina haptotyla CBS 200.50]|uniref:Uncharacterized protein n=1 Tax=Dactylellina haptotyla (strain CBS 200.50) TaxID=1284197 RepID=S7ZYX4_DACHA|nr:hypothetical protein H072_10945 [Dactylellina haptotyla CBS 200.50]
MTTSWIQDGDTIYFVFQTGTTLKERTFDGALTLSDTLGPAISNTPGVYFLGEKRNFYCIDEHGVLQDFQFDDEEGEWQPGELAAVGAKPALKSDIAVVAGPQDGGVQIFFQHVDGEIQSVQCDATGAWCSPSILPPVEPSADLSIYAINSDAVIHVFYTSQDNSIHELVFGNEWIDSKIPHTESALKKHALKAVPYEDGYLIQFNQFNDVDEEVYTVYKEEVTLVGKYHDGVFTKHRDAEGFNEEGAKPVILNPSIIPRIKKP